MDGCIWVYIEHVTIAFKLVKQNAIYQLPRAHFYNKNLHLNMRTFHPHISVYKHIHIHGQYIKKIT